MRLGAAHLYQLPLPLFHYSAHTSTEQAVQPSDSVMSKRLKHLVLKVEGKQKSTRSDLVVGSGVERTFCRLALAVPWLTSQWMGR